MHTMYAARKNGLEPVDYDWLTDDPDEQRLIASVLEETYGLIVYQEQMMQLSGLVAGFDAKERSKLRKAVGKKLKDQMAEVGQMLLDRAEQEFRDDRGQVYLAIGQPRHRSAALRRHQGRGRVLVQQVALPAAYARLAWQTAYLKANWPAAYGAAILGATDDKDKRIEALHSLAAEGIDVLPPDVNSSGVQTRPEGSRAVRLGLAEVKGTGEQVAARIVAAPPPERSPPCTTWSSGSARATTPPSKR